MPHLWHLVSPLFCLLPLFAFAVEPTPTTNVTSHYQPRSGGDGVVNVQNKSNTTTTTFSSVGSPRTFAVHRRPAHSTLTPHARRQLLTARRRVLSSESPSTAQHNVFLDVDLCVCGWLVAILCWYTQCCRWLSSPHAPPPTKYSTIFLTCHSRRVCVGIQPYEYLQVRKFLQSRILLHVLAHWRARAVLHGHHGHR